MASKGHIACGLFGPPQGMVDALLLKYPPKGQPRWHRSRFWHLRTPPVEGVYRSALTNVRTARLSHAGFYNSFLSDRQSKLQYHLKGSQAKTHHQAVRGYHPYCRLYLQIFPHNYTRGQYPYNGLASRPHSHPWRGPQNQNRSSAAFAWPKAMTCPLPGIRGSSQMVFPVYKGARYL